jgi:hypothetical protein
MFNGEMLLLLQKVLILTAPASLATGDMGGDFETLARCHKIAVSAGTTSAPAGMAATGVSPTVGRSVEEFVDLGCSIELRLSSSVAAGLAGIGLRVPALLREGDGRILDVYLDVVALAAVLRPRQTGVRLK